MKALVPILAIIALCTVVGTMPEHVEKSMPYWLRHMTPTQERILGTVIVLSLVLLGSLIELRFEMHGASIGH